MNLDAQKCKWSQAMMLAFAIVVLPNAILAQTDLDVRWKFAKGQSFTVELKQTSVAKSQVDSRKSSLTTETTLEFDWQVMTVDDQGTATVKQTISRVAVAVGDPAVPGQAVEYDTDLKTASTPVSRKLLRQIKPLVGLVFSSKIKSTGKIELVELDEVAEAAVNRLPAALQLKKLFSKDGIKQLLAAAALELPSDAKVGSTWELQEKLMSRFGEVAKMEKFTIGDVKVSEDRKIVEITMIGSLDSPIKPAVAPRAATGKEKAPTLKNFSSTGLMKFDIEQGCMISGKSSSTAETEKPYREKKIKTTVENSIEVKVEKTKS